MRSKTIIAFIIGMLFGLSIFAAADELLVPGKFSGTITYSGSSTGPVFLVLFTEPTFNNNTAILPLPAFGKYTVINLIPGTYYLAVFMDCNLSQNPDLGHEPISAYGGFYQPTPIVVTSGGNTQNINVTLTGPPVGDTTSPTVVSASPANGAVNVATTTRTFSFTFSEPIWIDFRSGEVTLTDYGASFTHSWSTDGKTLTFTADRDLPDNTTFIWTINAAINDSDALTDLAGNPLITKTGAFSTGATLNIGGLKGTISYSGSSTGKINLWVFSDQSFDKPISFNIINSPGSYTVTNLSPGTYYTAAVMDINGNYQPDVGHEPMGVYGSSWYQPTPLTVTAHATTANINITLSNPVSGDTTPPHLVSSTPANGAYNVSTANRTVSFTFNEPMWMSPSIYWDGIDSENATYSWSTNGKTLTYTFPNRWYQNITISWTLNPSDDMYMMDLAGNMLPTTTGSFTTQSIGNIPDIRLNIARTELEVFQLNQYLLAGGSPIWTWNSYNTFANISINNSNYGSTDYLTPLQWTAGMDTVTYTAPGYGSDQSILKYSSYVFNGKLPSALVDNGTKVANCDIPLSNYFVNLGAPPLGSALYAIETIRYSNSADTGKLSVSFSGDTVRINPTGTLKGKAEIVVKVYTSTANDWDKEIIRVHEIANSYNQFTTGSDTTKWYYQVYADGTGPGTLSWQSAFSGSSTGILKINQKPGEKGKLSQIFTVPSPGWYTAKAKVATDVSNPAKQQKAYLYLQEFSQDTVITACANQVIAANAGGFGSANTGKTMKISFYAASTILGAQVVAINPSNSGVTSNMYIDYIYVYPAGPEADIAYGANNIAVNNGEFYTGDTSNWLIQVYADGSGTGTWDVINAIDPDNNDDHWQILRGVQSGGEKAKVSQTIELHYFIAESDKNAAPSVWVYSGAASQSQTQKVYLYLYSYDTAYSTVVESGNAILYAGQWTPGKWTQLRFGYTPMTLYNAIQVVGINPTGNPSQTIYFDDIELAVDMDTYNYWDHTLF